MLSALLREWLKLQVKLGLSVYFRRLPVTGASTIPASGPLLFAANHQNSFLDALMVTITQPREMHYLVRSDVFRKPWADRMLRMLNMLPVFRIRDGWQTLGNNAPTFARCVEIFRSGGAVLIFPEGNHSTLHRLRPLSRGFTKPIALALEADPTLSIHVVPVGLNFSHHTAFRAPASVHYGKPIAVQDHYHDGLLDANSLRAALSAALKELVVHIEDATEAETLAAQLKSAGADLTDPAATNELIRKVKQDGVIIAPAPSTARTTTFSRSLFRLLHFLPLAGWYRLHKTIRDPMFTGSLKSVYGIFVFPLYYLMAGGLLLVVAGPLAAAALLIMMVISVQVYRN